MTLIGSASLLYFSKRRLWKDFETLRMNFDIPDFMTYILKHAHEKWKKHFQDYSFASNVHPSILKALFYSDTPSVYEVIADHYELDPEISKMEDCGDIDDVFAIYNRRNPNNRFTVEEMMDAAYEESIAVESSNGLTAKQAKQLLLSSTEAIDKIDLHETINREKVQKTIGNNTLRVKSARAKRVRTKSDHLVDLFEDPVEIKAFKRRNVTATTVVDNGVMDSDPAKDHTFLDPGECCKHDISCDRNEFKINGCELSAEVMDDATANDARNEFDGVFSRKKIGYRTLHNHWCDLVERGGSNPSIHPLLMKVLLLFKSLCSIFT